LGVQRKEESMGRILWTPPEERVLKSYMYAFMQEVNKRHNKNFKEYSELWEWSVENIPEFWAAVWDFVDISASEPYKQVVDDPQKMPGAKWFMGAKLNFARNLLRRKDGKIALIFKGEGQPIRKVTYNELYSKVSRLSQAFKDLGVTPGDRVVGFMPNMPETTMGMLAATSLGAIWSSCSPDFGIKGVMDRFGQIKPKVLIAADGYFFKGKRFDSTERIKEFSKQLPSLERIILVPYTEMPSTKDFPKAVLFDDIIKPYKEMPIDFAELPFEHPLYIMYSSGTTGLPKCMVQSAGGILINHKKELMLHVDLKPEDVIFYYTTCGWMMWNWLMSSLSVGATLVLYDGNPFQPGPEALWELTEEAKINIFGTSAGYISALMASGLRPKERFGLESLKTILSTGSPLSVEGFEFVYDSIKSDVHLASISGGTDLNGCFVAGNPMAPVYAGEIQCRCLGMKVFAYDENGKPVYNKQGELVCTAAFPSMPIYFWDDPDNKKYHSAYFDVYPNVWRHGDFIEINDRGGVIIYGRSDATLNPGGVRIGTAEIYRLVEQLPEIEDSIVVGQDWKNDVRVILFVKMAPGFKLTQEIRDKIRNTLRENASPRHVPAKIIEIPDIPYTLNMKKVELAVKKVIHGQPVLNKDALRNPECLDYYLDLPELKED